MQSLSPSQSPPVLQRFLPLLALLFIGSGCSALIYEVVWLQSLQLVIGSSAVSLGVLLGTFMGGMCLGSLVLPRVVSTRRHPLRVYALLELGIGVAGLALLFGMPYVDQLYAAHVKPGLASILMRGAVCAVCLLPPTLLMGATLPAIARWVEATPRGVSWLGFFYGSNIAGAVFGRLLAASTCCESTTAPSPYAAAALNFTVAVTALLLAGRAAYQAQARRVGCALQSDQRNRRGTVGTAHPDEILKRRGLGSSGHRLVRADRTGGGGRLDAESVAAARRDRLTFSIILAVFLVGLGIGSSIGSVVSRHVCGPACVGCLPVAP
jgi:spermidine synthase